MCARAHYSLASELVVVKKIALPQCTVVPVTAGMDGTDAWLDGCMNGEGVGGWVSRWVDGASMEGQAMRAVVIVGSERSQMVTTLFARQPCKPLWHWLSYYLNTI